MTSEPLLPEPPPERGHDWPLSPPGEREIGAATLAAPRYVVMYVQPDGVPRSDTCHALPGRALQRAEEVRAGTTPSRMHVWVVDREMDGDDPRSTVDEDDACPDCHHLWRNDLDACPNCHLTAEDLVAAADQLSDLRGSRRRRRPRPRRKGTP